MVVRHIRHIHNRIKKTHQNNRKFLKNPFFWLVILVGTFIIYKSMLPLVNADSSTNPLRTARIDAVIQNPYQEGITTEFPDGQSFIEVGVNVYKNDGTPLANEPITIVKPASVLTVGPKTTEDGHFTLKFASNKSQLANIKIKLTNCSTVKASFKIRFAQDKSIKDVSDKNSFITGTPLTLQAEIKPWMTDHLLQSEVKYIYTRRVNKWGFWVKEKRVVTGEMTCNDGVCSATFASTNTDKDRNSNQTFSYSFVFKDANGKVFTKSGRGKLIEP